MTAAEKRVIADKYEILGVLGEGGTGVVYDAVRIGDRRPVALKVMHETLAGDKQIRGRFQREAAILRRLQGEHICAILDFGELLAEDQKTLLYIALPKIEGESLADLLAKGPIDVDRGLDIMMQVLAGLAAAHAQGVIHRDLKPANVLIEGGKKAVVVDFGMSKIITGGGVGTTNLTTHNMLFGTPEYMSPEQARGDELDARTDVYAAGVILYEMITGSPPFTGETPLSILTAHLTSDVEPPSKRAKPASRVTPALESVILGALARDRDERYRSASVLAAAIAHARQHPNEAGAVHPSAFTATPSTNIFADTMPATVIGEPGVDATAPTLLGDKPPLASSMSPPHPTVPPKSRPRLPSIPSMRPPEPKDPTRTWVLLWVIVGLASIALGVWFALRR